MRTTDDELPEGGAPSLRAHVAGIALASTDAKRLSEFYVGAMGYKGQWSDERWTGFLDARWMTIREGTANKLDYVAFALPDPHGLSLLRDRLRAASVEFEEVAPTALRGASIKLTDPDGNALLFGVGRGELADDTYSFRSSRLQHLVFASDDPPAMVRFYCDVAGFAPSDYVKDNSDRLTSAFLRCSAEHHTVAIFRGAQKRLDHFCYDVKDWMQIRDWADRFAERHIELRWGPGRHGPGNNLFFFVNDPDGNWLEFSSELERVEGSRPVKLWAHEERTLNSWGSAYMRC
jgi:catechol 2,3-dioxygenase-like lactoylglutathione lyase family enzyme